MVCYAAMFLRPYQVDLLSDIRESARRHKRILVQAPTGSGKSVIFANIIERAKEKGVRTLFLVHRRELIYQAMEHLKKVGVQCGIIMAGELETGGQDCQLGCVPSVYRRKSLDISRYGLVIIDEAHRAGNHTTSEIIKRTNGARLIGFTATPIRKGGTPLGGCFDSLVCGPSVRSLIADKYLADIEYMAPTILDMRGTKTVGGEFSEKDINGKIVPKLRGGVVDHYEKYAGDKGIIFSCGIKHSNYLKEDFLKHGRMALVIDSDCSQKERDELLAEFVASERAILINVAIFEEGFDAPQCDTIVMARPTKSLRVYLQCVGRGMRPKEGNKPLLVIDHGGNIYRHGLVEEDRAWSLTVGENTAAVSKRQREMVSKYATCPQCGAMVVGAICKCGHEITKLRRAQNVRELKNCGLQLVDKSKISERSPRVTNGKFPDLKVWIWILGFTARKAYKAGFAAHMYKSRYGHWPGANPLLKGKVPKAGEWKGDCRIFMRKIGEQI